MSMSSIREKINVYEHDPCTSAAERAVPPSNLESWTSVRRKKIYSLITQDTHMLCVASNSFNFTLYLVFKIFTRYGNLVRTFEH